GPGLHRQRIDELVLDLARKPKKPLDMAAKELAPRARAAQQLTFLRAVDEAEIGIVFGVDGAAHLRRFALQPVGQFAITSPQGPAVGVGAIELARHQAKARELAKKTRIGHGAGADHRRRPCPAKRRVRPSKASRIGYCGVQATLWFLR